MAAVCCASPDPRAALLQRRHAPPEQATYSLSCSWVCRALRSPFRLFTAPRRRSFSCRCNVGLDAEGVREVDLAASEAWALGLSIELSFWRRHRHLLFLILLF